VPIDISYPAVYANPAFLDAVSVRMPQFVLPAWRVTILLMGLVARVLVIVVYAPIHQSASPAQKASISPTIPAILAASCRTVVRAITLHNVRIAHWDTIFSIIPVFLAQKIALFAWIASRVLDVSLAMLSQIYHVHKLTRTAHQMQMEQIQQSIMEAQTLINQIQLKAIARISKILQMAIILTIMIQIRRIVPPQIIPLHRPILLIRLKGLQMRQTAMPAIQVAIPAIPKI
jgi:hypothetical protein